MTILRGIRTALLSLPTLAALLCGVAVSQPRLSVERSDDSANVHRVYFSASCDGLRRYDYRREEFTLKRESVSTDAFDLMAPDTTAFCGQSICLLVDVGPDFQGARLDTLRMAVRALVDALDPARDELEICSYRNGFAIEQAATSDTALLRAAARALPSAQRTPGGSLDALLDRCKALAQRPATRCRSIIVLQESADTAGYLSHKFFEVRNLAAVAGVVIHSAYLWGDRPHDVILWLAHYSGGLQEEYSSLYMLAEICTWIVRQQRQYNPSTLGVLRIPYRRVPCDSLPFPTYDIRWTSCQSSASASAWAEEVDSATLLHATMAVDSQTVFGGCSFETTLRMTPRADAPVFPIRTLELRLAYDTSVLRYDAISKTGTLLESTSVNAWTEAGGLYFSANVKTAIRMDGPLLRLRFRAADSPAGRIVPVTPEAWSSFGYCADIAFETSTIRIIPNSAADPVVISIADTSGRKGSRFTVRVRAQCDEARGTRFTPASMLLQHSAAQLACEGIETNHETLFDSTEIAVLPARGGTVCVFTARREVTGDGTLFYARFRAVVDSASGPYRATPGQLELTEGCVHPVYSSGTIRVTDGTSAVGEHAVKSEASIIQTLACSPNPSDGEPTLRVSMRTPSRLDIRVYSLLGTVVATIADARTFAPGSHALPLPLASLPCGVYVVRVTAEQGESRQAILLRK